MTKPVNPSLIGIRRCLETLTEEARALGAQEVALLMEAAIHAAREAEKPVPVRVPRLRLVSTG